MTSYLSMLLKFALLILSLCHAAPLPSCESDTSSHCLGDGADLSPEGIEACLQACTTLCYFNALGAQRSR